jgi:hypothetical protein
MTERLSAEERAARSGRDACFPIADPGPSRVQRRVSAGGARRAAEAVRGAAQGTRRRAGQKARALAARLPRHRPAAMRKQPAYVAQPRQTAAEQEAGDGAAGIIGKFEHPRQYAGIQVVGAIGRIGVEEDDRLASVQLLERRLVGGIARPSVAKLVDRLMPSAFSVLEAYSIS